MSVTPYTQVAQKNQRQTFADLDDFIRVITAQIWEGRQIDLIRNYYSDPCAVITPSGATTAVQSVIDGTVATLAQFPDRRLLAEDVIQAGDAAGGFLSSHRIVSTMTHAGDGNFGAASGKSIMVRTVADCVCKDDRIVHEWLVRDQGAIALAVGSSPKAIAAQWLASRANQPLLPLPKPAAPTWWKDPKSTEPIALAYANNVAAALTGDRQRFNTALYDEAITGFGPNNQVWVGRDASAKWYGSYAAAVSQPQLSIESLTFMPASSATGRPPRVAIRWRLQGEHCASERFGQDCGNQLDILGIHHAEFVKVNQHWQVHREWVLIDEVALWMQILDKKVQS